MKKSNEKKEKVKYDDFGKEMKTLSKAKVSMPIRKRKRSEIDIEEENNISDLPNIQKLRQ